MAPTACAGKPEPTASIWPPPDFELHARAGTDRVDSIGVRQTCDVLPDGLVVYREVADEDRARPGPPVFRRLCAYRLAPESLRMLARLLHRAGLFESEPPVPEERTGEWVWLTWHAFEKKGQSLVRGRVYGPLVRVLHVLNAFLPPERAIRVGDMGGDPEPRHVQDVPQPVASLAGSLAFHVQLLERWPRDTQWLLDTFALAVAAGRKDLARELLRRLEAQQATPFPDEDVRVVLDELRALIDG